MKKREEEISVTQIRIAKDKVTSRRRERNLLIKASHCKWEFHAAMQLQKYEEKRGFPPTFLSFANPLLCNTKLPAMCHRV